MSLAKYATGLECRITEQLVDAILAEGIDISVNDGEETTVRDSTDRAEILDALASTGIDYLFGRRDGQDCGFVMLIYGNGEDLISDSSATGPIADITDRIIEQRSI